MFYFNFKKIFLIFLLLLNNFIFSNEIPVGAKYIALGGISSAVSQDVYSIYYNSALLDKIKQIQLALEYRVLYLDVDHTPANFFIGFAVPIRRFGSFGLCISNLIIKNLYSEYDISFCYSKKNFLFKNFGFGFKIKNKIFNYVISKLNYFDDEIIPDVEIDPIFKNGSLKSIFSLDCGFSYNINKNIILGLTLNNINQPNLSLSGNVKDLVLDKKACFSFYLINKFINLNLDFLLKQDEYCFNLGIEKRFKLSFSILGSLKYLRRIYNEKIVENKELALGFEYRFRKSSVSYCINLPFNELGIFGSHTLSLLFKF